MQNIYHKVPCTDYLQSGTWYTARDSKIKTKWIKLTENSYKKIKTKWIELTENSYKNQNTFLSHSGIPLNKYNCECLMFFV